MPEFPQPPHKEDKTFFQEKKVSDKKLYDEDVLAEFNIAAYELEHFSHLLRAANGKLFEGHTNPEALLQMCELLELACNSINYILGLKNHKSLVSKLRKLHKKILEYKQNNQMSPNELREDPDWVAILEEAKDIHSRINYIKGKLQLGIPTRVRESDLDKLEALL